ncbi:hypothetical protein PAXRUDRAFT_18256 [Paxillus rubicundulus Ve08.2h10]|uniref:Uncharacterized protein n=1 Tax=Paxillus rubicundulus Ve08.2h10 TaxID=930991 RepID=A0A0D0CM94_9AGAM|nr:hypothetical protein PAXRUDRAFT_19810 [Paxillus rubicundulus Ve08.2h10]KIK76393.1 hypothetical protein PAXRUDRAFT_18256 [Paxillus rubicundulus Ve08.2h10]
MVYHLPTVKEATPVPSLPKRPWKICRACSNQQSSGEGTSIDPHATEPHFPPISQLVVPAQPKPRKNNDFEATGHHTRPGELVIPATPKTAVNQAIRTLPQHTSTQIDIPSRPKKVCRISTTRQSLSTLFLPSEPKASHSRLDSVQSMPGPSNPILAPNVFNEPEDIAMDHMDVDPSPSQINPVVPEPDFQPGSSKKHSPDVLSDPHARPDARNIGQEWPCLQTDLCVDPVTENHFADTLAVQISYQVTPDPRKIDYKEGLDDPLKRAMEDYQQMFAAACKHRRCVLEQQKRLVVELETLHMEQKKYII